MGLRFVERALAPLTCRTDADHLLPGQGGECIGLAQIVGQCGSHKPSAQAPVRGLYYVGCDAGGYGCGTHQAVDSGVNVAQLVQRAHVVHASATAALRVAHDEASPREADRHAVGVLSRWPRCSARAAGRTAGPAAMRLRPLDSAGGQAAEATGLPGQDYRSSRAAVESTIRVSNVAQLAATWQADVTGGLTTVPSSLGTVRTGPDGPRRGDRSLPARLDWRDERIQSGPNSVAVGWGKVFVCRQMACSRYAATSRACGDHAGEVSHGGSTSSRRCLMEGQ
jgi:hypothetical protein